MIKNIVIKLLFVLVTTGIFAQQKSMVNTSQSPFAKMQPVNIGSVHWTNGFWTDWNHVCQNSMVPLMMGNYMDDSISHAFANFEIAAGLKEGKHEGPPFHDGDFYKILEALIMVYAQNPNENTGKKIDDIIAVISQTQREDGYIHSPVVIEQRQHPEKKKEFAERLDFETYNMGHLMTAACLHYRITEKQSLLEIAIKATDFLYDFYKRAPEVLAKNAICPSHYMGVAEMYRTTSDERYKELASQLIEIRSMVTEGTDHNQDRIPFKKQTEAIGHAVRANYLYAGAADVYLETGDDSLYMALNAIWQDLVSKKMYITGACGALYDGVSPNGTSYSPPDIQQVHQAYGRPYELPNLTAHNESCANIGNLLWNWRMLLATGDARFADVMETIMYNSLLAGVSLDGKGYFYTNPLAVTDAVSHDLRWSKIREPYISYCNCCPPNTIRTIAEIQNYMYSLSENALWVHFYGGNKLSTITSEGEALILQQETNYPWDGKILLTIEKAPKKEMELKMRIPSWASDGLLMVNEKEQLIEAQSGKYVSIIRKWKKGDVIDLDLFMEPILMASNPLVEENRNQVAVKRGPVVYCLESNDTPDYDVLNVSLPLSINWEMINEEISGQELVSLKGTASVTKKENWNDMLYKPIQSETIQKEIKLVPYYAWGNRGKGDMTVWLPISRE